MAERQDDPYSSARAVCHTRYPVELFQLHWAMWDASVWEFVFQWRIDCRVSRAGVVFCSISNRYRYQWLLFVTK
jgi:hypothetical protein